MKRILITTAMCMILTVGCYTLSKFSPLWEIPTPRKALDVLPERVEELERRVFTDIWTQC